MYDVVVEDSARADLAENYRRLQQDAHDPDYPDEWLDEMYHAIGTLADLPFRCSRAPEDEYFVEEIRQRLIGRYRVLFTVRGQTVHVLHVRHMHRQVLRPEEK